MEGVQKLQSLVEESTQEREQLQTQLDEEIIRSAYMHLVYRQGRLLGEGVSKKQSLHFRNREDVYSSIIV
jgi:hypothetical protein